MSVTWTTREGQVLEIKAMSLDHMHRCVHMICRNRRLSLLMVMDAVSALRYAADAPDGAAMAAEEEATRLMDAAYDLTKIDDRLPYAIRHSKPIAAMVKRLRKARVDFLKTPTPYQPPAKRTARVTREYFRRGPTKARKGAKQ